MSYSTDQLRTTEEDGEWADLNGPPSLKHFSEPQLGRWEHYNGRLRDMPEDKALALLKELLDYFQVDGAGGMPFPPSGLPGALNKKYDWNSPEWEFISIGYDYFLATARGQSRAMHNRWKDARQFLSRTTAAAREALIDEQLDRQRQRYTERERGAKAQLVYFIGSESGPIKIGKAVDPQSRRKDLQTSHHERLEILATREGGTEQESAYHRQFASRRLSGEWFERCPEILAEIERLSS